MRFASLSSPNDRRRTIGFAVTLLVHLLVVLAVLFVKAPLPPGAGKLRDLVMINLSPALKPAEKKAKQEEKKKQEQKPNRPRSALAPPPDAPPPVVPSKSSLNLMPIDLASSDIGKLPHAEKSGSESGGPTTPSVEGPGGMRLFDAEWYREPTHAELSPYLPHSQRPKSWGLIACQTAPRYRVENCRELDESPPGSGMAHGVVEAAWQFRVLPPRINGKEMIGEWVRIRIDLTTAPGE